MPIYDYVCEACGHRLEVMHGVYGRGPDRCPACGAGPMRKAFAPPAVLFKGSGWAKKDRRSAAGKAAGKTEAGTHGDEAKPTGSTESGEGSKTPSKPESSASPSTPAVSTD